jgi:pyruvate formate lyase activating enzyme
LEFSKQALTEASGRILRICRETNGNMNSGFLDEMLELSLRSGGCIKFDLKAWKEDLHKALTGVSNLQTLENFSRAGGSVDLRFEPPLLVASTLLVPSYVEETEVRSIARFIASIDPNIPYSLLAFYPHFFMQDLPLMERSMAEVCYAAAKDEGLNNVRLGNEHLLI